MFNISRRRFLEAAGTLAAMTTMTQEGTPAASSAQFVLAPD